MRVLEALSDPENCMAVRYSSEYAGQCDKTTLLMDQKHSRARRIDEATMRIWKNPRSASELGMKLIDKNEFIPTEVSTKQTGSPYWSPRKFQLHVSNLRPPILLFYAGNEGMIVPKLRLGIKIYPVQRPLQTSFKEETRD